MRYAWVTDYAPICHCKGASLGKYTRMLIGVETEKMDIHSKQWAVIDFCFQLGKDIGEKGALL